MKTSYYFHFKIAGHRARIAGHSDRVPAIIYITEVIRSVLTNLGGVECGRLPKATFSRYMFLEARRLAQIHVAEELLTDWDATNFKT